MDHIERQMEHLSGLRLAMKDAAIRLTGFYNGDYPDVKGRDRVILERELSEQLKHWTEAFLSYHDLFYKK